MLPGLDKPPNEEPLTLCVSIVVRADISIVEIMVNDFRSIDILLDKLAIQRVAELFDLIPISVLFGFENWLEELAQLGVIHAPAYSNSTMI